MSSPQLAAAGGPVPSGERPYTKKEGSCTVLRNAAA